MAREQMTILIEERSGGMTIAQYLKRELRFTEAQIRSIKFREKGILVNGQRARVIQKLTAGDILCLGLSDQRNQSAHLLPSDTMPEILYEDEDVICADKPAGLVIHPSHGHYQDSLSNQLRAYFLKKGTDVQIRSIGRLDKDTSGVVVFAKHQIAAARLWEQKEQGIFRKEYLAWCEGVFEPEELESEQTVDVPIAHAPGELMKMCVVTGEQVQESSKTRGTNETANRGAARNMNATGNCGDSGDVGRTGNCGDNGDVGRTGNCGDNGDVGRTGNCGDNGKKSAGMRAVTHYQVISQERDRALVRLHLETGRTHQIRVHMAYLGHPLIGDPIYGNGAEGKTHAQLWAWKAEFRQPFGEKMISVCSGNLDKIL